MRRFIYTSLVSISYLSPPFFSLTPSVPLSGGEGEGQNLSLISPLQGKMPVSNPLPLQVSLFVKEGSRAISSSKSPLQGRYLSSSPFSLRYGNFGPLYPHTLNYSLNHPIDILQHIFIRKPDNSQAQVTQVFIPNSIIFGYLTR